MAPSETRLGDLIAALSLATDLGNGFPLEKTLRNTLLAEGLARRLGMPDDDVRDVYHYALIRFVGCTALAYEMGDHLGDDIATRNAFAPVDDAHPAEAMKVIFTELGKGLGARRARVVARALTGRKQAEESFAADCEVAGHFSERLRMRPGVTRALTHAFERWDGKGLRKLRGEDIEPAARVVEVAHAVEIHLRRSGPEGARAFVERGAGGWFDPSVVEAYRQDEAELREAITGESVWDRALAAEPQPHVYLSEARVGEVAEAFADFVDLQSPHRLGHSTGVAALARAAAASVGMSDADQTTVERAALVHDLGRVSVPNIIWGKPGPLNAAEWERVRLHPYYTERILAPSAPLAALGKIAGLHHERLDGSGYHRNVGAGALGQAARILAAADAYHAMTEPRPHRPAFAPEVAAKELRAEAAAGRLDHEAVAAVLDAAGHKKERAPRGGGPAGLSEREIEVLRLLARGLSKKQIAKELFIAPGTVHTHVVHIYDKLGVSTRAGAALAAMERGLLLS